MADLKYQIFILTGLLIMFHLTGIIPAGETPTSVLLSIVLNPANILHTLFATKIEFAILGAVGVVAGVGTVLLSSDKLGTAANVALLGFLIMVVTDYLYVISKIGDAGALGVIIALIATPFVLYYVFTVYDTLRGHE